MDTEIKNELRVIKNMLARLNNRIIAVTELFFFLGCFVTTKKNIGTW
jgi:hypothetical protein